MLTLVILFNTFKNSLCLWFGDKLWQSDKDKVPDKLPKVEKKETPIVSDVKKVELPSNGTQEIDSKRILEEQKNVVVLDIKSDLENLNWDLKTKYQKKFEEISNTSDATVDQLKSFREDVRLIRVTWKVKDDFKKWEPIKIDLSKKPKENFFLSNLPESVLSINYNWELYTRSVWSRKWEFIHVNEDNTFNILKPSDKMELSLSEVVSKEDISKKLKSENEKLENYKTVIDKAVVLKIRERWLNEKILLEKVKDDLLSDEEERVSDNIDELKWEEKTKKQKELDKFMTDKYPWFPSNLTKLNEKIDDYLDDYRFEKWAYYVPKNVLEKVSAIKDEKEKKEKVMEILKPQVDLAVRTYPTTWTKGNKVTTENPELAEMKDNPIFQLVNYLFKWLLWVDLFEEMGKEYNKDYNDPEKAREQIWNMVGWDDSLNLGCLSEYFENWWKWSYCINPNDWWSPSFWTYQLHNDLLWQFAIKNWISWNYKEKWKNTEFARNWISKVDSYEAEHGKWSFKKLEFDFIKATHYNPQMNKISRDTFYVDPNVFSMSLKNVIWSTSVQFWANTDVVVDAIKNLWKKLDYADLNNQRKLIEEIYKIRTNRLPSDKWRYQKEKSIALQNLSINLASASDSEIKMPRWIVSFPAEREGSTTLCSRTAYKNLTQTFWISLNPEKSKWDANKVRDNYKASWELKTSFPPNDWSVAEIFCESLKFPQFGHRSVAFKDNWNWYILDPYLAVVKWKATREPILWSTYKSYLDKVGRTFYWAKTY